MTNTRSPCHECICVPICRHKSYIKVTHDCSRLISYFFGKTSSLAEPNKGYWPKSEMVKEDLKPVRWGVFK